MPRHGDPDAWGLAITEIQDFAEELIGRWRLGTHDPDPWAPTLLLTCDDDRRVDVLRMDFMDREGIRRVLTAEIAASRATVAALLLPVYDSKVDALQPREFLATVVRPDDHAVEFRARVTPWQSRRGMRIGRWKMTLRFEADDFAAADYAASMFQGFLAAGHDVHPLLWESGYLRRLAAERDGART